MAKKDRVFDPTDEISDGGGTERPDLASMIELRCGDLPFGFWFNTRTSGGVVGIEAMPKIDGATVFFFAYIDDHSDIIEYFDREVAATEEALDELIKSGYNPRAILCKGLK